MKKVFLFLACWTCFTLAQAQLITQSEIQQVKNSKTILALTGNPELDETIRQLVAERWSFTSNSQFGNILWFGIGSGGIDDWKTGLN